MVKVIIGDIFKSKAQTLVNTVNCVGVMGKGIALQFKNRFPEMFKDYERRCKANKVKLGRPYLYGQKFLFQNYESPWVLNFPTKDHWRSVSRLNDIIEGFKYLEKHYKEWGITSLAVPPLGCGEGQLEWRVVGPTLYRYLKKLEIPVELYAPFGTPHEELQPAFLDKSSRQNLESIPQKIKASWVALVKILKLIEKEPYHWPIGRTMFQKIAYFATEKDIPTGLNYRRSSYGPYAPELKGIITKLVNNGLIKEKRLGRMFEVQVGPTYDDAYKIFSSEIKKWDEDIEKLADLFMRLRTKESELASTVYFASKSLKRSNSNQASESDVLKEVLDWKKKRKPPLDEAEVACTIRNLNLLSWLNLKVSSDLPIAEESFYELLEK